MYNPCDTCTEQKCNICTMQLKKFKQPQKDDVLVIKLDQDSNAYIVSRLCKFLEEEFPNNTIITAPIGYELEVFGRDQIKKYVDYINEHLS